MREKIKDNRDYLITTEDLRQWEIDFKRNLEPLIILWTGWAERWPDKEKYLGTSSNDIQLLRFPGKSSFPSCAISLSCLFFLLFRSFEVYS